MAWANKVRGGSTAVVAPPAVSKHTDDSKRVWSDQQKAIFEWFASSKVAGKVHQNLIVMARAGTGKTTTIVKAIEFIPKGQEVLLAAFNKRIATELEARVNHPNATVKTLHSVGFGIIKEYVPRVRLSKGDDRARDLALKACGKDIPDTILKLVMKLHTKAREITPFAKVDKAGFEQVYALGEQFECDPEFFWQAQGFDLKWITAKALKCLELATEEDPTTIDFADMIFIPLVKGWAAPRFDVGCVDEAQDMTVAQLELFRRVIRKEGRICVIGDDRQAIYAFRGADSGSLARLRKELSAAQLGLTVTYRCGRRIVEEAQQFVDDFTAGPNNPEGEVVSIVREDMLERVAYGDFILSRLNAPLAGYAMALLREKRRARIAGRDIGQSIKTTIRKISKGAITIEDFLTNLEAYREKMAVRYKAFKNSAQKLEELADLVETMTAIALGCETVGQMESTVDALFTDDGLGDKGIITLSSVHKAKGLEADKVFVLGWTLRTGKNQEEDNIHYVAITRAKNVLTMVA